VDEVRVVGQGEVVALVDVEDMSRAGKGEHQLGVSPTLCEPGDRDGERRHRADSALRGGGSVGGSGRHIEAGWLAG